MRQADKIQFLAKAIDGADSFGYKLSPLWDSNLKNEPNSAAAFSARNASKCVLAKPPLRRSNHFSLPDRITSQKSFLRGFSV
jgi:hypothetical protein